METNEDRKRRLDALASGGLAGQKAYFDQLNRQQEQQRKATSNLLASASPAYGVGSEGAQYEMAVAAGRRTQPAWAELATAGQQWDEQVPYEQAAVSKLMSDTSEAIADMQREAEIGRSIASERTNVSLASQREEDRVRAQIEQARNSAAEAEAAAAKAAANPPPPSLPSFFNPTEPKRSTKISWKNLW